MIGKTTKRNKIMSQKPEIATQEMFDYLEELRESGEANMMGAGPYLEMEFCLSRREAREVLRYWLFSYKRSEAA
jgi:hypothetical protein